MDGSKSPSKSLPVSQQDTIVPPRRPPAPPGRAKTSIHVTALDGILTVNSLFTIAVFIGFSLTTPDSAGAGHRSSCDPSIETVRRIIVFDIVSFGFFMFSSLIAQSMKLAINLVNSLNPEEANKAEIDTFCMKYGLLGSAIGSILGCLFMMLSVVYFIQVKLGVLSCGGDSAYAIVTLVILVGSSLLVYILTAVYVTCLI